MAQEISGNHPISREDNDKILLGIEDMIYKLVRGALQFPLDENDIVEIVQECRVWLWEKSIPKFDPQRGVKMSTFLYRCASNFIQQRLRSMSRAAAGHHDVTMEQTAALAAALEGDDRIEIQVERAAERVMLHPERYFTATQCRVFYAMTDNPNMRKKDLAVLLGYKRASSLSMMVRRIKERILGLDVESLGGAADG